MDLAKTLVRSVVRAFYDTRHILVVDALVIHSALRDDDLAYLMSMNTKDLHKLCGKLREDRFISVHSRSELRDGQQRPNNRTYYYIDYRQTIDAIKWRVYKIDKDMQGPVVPPSEKKEYFCDRCKAEWTQMEVLDNVGPAGFLCHRCGYVLRHSEGGQSGGHEKSTRMNNQFKFITELLPKIDSVVVPDNNFDVAFNNKHPVIRDSTHQTAPSIGVDASNKPTAVKGLTNTGPNKMSVSIQAGSGPTEEEKAAERALKEKIAQQNELPSWMSNSTVTGEAFKLSGAAAGTGGGAIKSDADAKDPTIKSTTDATEDAAIDDYFEKLKQQAAEEAQRRQQEESSDEGDEDDDDDEEGEFEDVVATASNSAAGTPASTAGGGLPPPPTSNPTVPSPLRQSSLKRDASSGPSTGSGNSPASGSDGRPTKKVKVEEPLAPEGPGGGGGGQSDDDDDDEEEEEDVEFEDAI